MKNKIKNSVKNMNNSFNVNKTHNASKTNNNNPNGNNNIKHTPETLDLSGYVSNIKKTNNKTATKTLFEYDHDLSKGQPQGSTYVGNYLVNVQPNEKTHKARLNFIKDDINNYSIDINVDCGHANEIAYDSKRKQLVIPYKDAQDKKLIKVIKLKSQENKLVKENGKFAIDTIETIEMPFNTSKITYDKKEDAYYVTASSGNKPSEMRKINAETFEMDNEYGVKTYQLPYPCGPEYDYYAQSIEVIDDKIYYLIDKKGEWKSSIIVYDKDMNMINKTDLSHKVTKGEVEAIHYSKANGLTMTTVAKDQGAKHGTSTIITKIDLSNNSSSTSNS